MRRFLMLFTVRERYPPFRGVFAYLSLCLLFLLLKNIARLLSTPSPSLPHPTSPLPNSTHAIDSVSDGFLLLLLGTQSASTSLEASFLWVDFFQGHTRRRKHLLSGLLPLYTCPVNGKQSNGQLKTNNALTLVTFEATVHREQ